MKWLLSILLISLIFASNDLVFEEDIEEKEEKLLSDEEMAKLKRAYAKAQKYHRYLESSDDSESESESESEEDSTDITSETSDINATESETVRTQALETQNLETTTPETTTPETTTPETTTPETTTPETTTPETTVIETEAPTQAPTQTPRTQAIVPTPPYPVAPVPATIYGAGVQIYSFNNFRPYQITTTVITITYVMGVFYNGYPTYLYIQMTLIITTRRFRALQEIEEKEEVPALCKFISQDPITGVCDYNCSADTNQSNFTDVQSRDDFEFKLDEDSNFTHINAGNLSFSARAAIGSLSLNTQTSKVSKFVFLNNAYVYKNSTSGFSVKGNLFGSKAEDVADQDYLLLAFSDISTGVVQIKNFTCPVTNHDLNDFEFRCEPDRNLTGSVYLSSAIINDEIEFIVNSTKDNDSVKVVIYGEGQQSDNGNSTETNTRYNNFFYGKSSSGLSGGAIAGIVIACAVVLIIITILAMFLRKHKATETNNSTIVGLKSVDNYAE